MHSVRMIMVHRENSHAHSRALCVIGCGVQLPILLIHVVLKVHYHIAPDPFVALDY